MAFSAVHASSLLNEHSIRFGDETIQYLKRFEFDHHTMTQSVIIERNGEKIVFVKGSPEAIGKLCVPSSLPGDFADHARYAARNGCVLVTRIYVLEYFRSHACYLFQRVYQLAMGKATYTSNKDMSEVQRSGEIVVSTIILSFLVMRTG
jgi:magnesium-transporting ATPase (P-type)